jgi:glycosyltransferase 2 family protein
VSQTPARGERGTATSRTRVTLQVVLTAVVVAFAARELWRQWSQIERTPTAWDIHPGWVAASCALVLATYALLIETWRRTLATWGAQVPFVEAARVWSVSNLGKYVPGKVWQISAMAVMMQRLGVALPVSATAALLITIANLAAGFAAVCLFGAATGVSSQSTYFLTLAILALTLSALAAAPPLASRLASVAGRVSGRRLTHAAVPRAAPWIGAVGCFVAWIGYGIAFRLFALGVVGRTPGGMGAYIAVFTASYLLGYLALFAPGGIGVRELALTTALPAMGLASPAEAALLTVTSRLWLTVLEVLPGLYFLTLGRRGPR